NPSLESHRHIVLRIGCYRTDGRTEVARTGAACAVLHPRNHVQSHKRVSIPRAHLRHYVLKIVDRVYGWQGGVAPSVIDDELPASCLKRFQVWISRVEYRAQLLIRELVVSLQFKRFQLPLRIVVDHIRKGLTREEILQPFV